ncbi:helix-turn-helix domain-containing protein [Solibacillus isronensis]|uniref:helix-turn-helix domain-containing protein n=1 Tax=Solibacillus isronensis TaxID=412383 RepID=UPI0039A24275
MAKMTEQTKARLIELRELGLGQKKIAVELGVTKSTIQRWLSKLGMDTKLENYKRNVEIVKVIVCKNCNIEYKTQRHHTKFCSDKCRATYNKANRGHKRKCERCNGTFLNYKEVKYCSSECSEAAFDERKKERELQIKIHEETKRRNIAITKLLRTIVNVKDKTKECVVCQKEFRGKYAMKYCSEECSSEGIRITRRKKRVSKDKRWRKNGKVDYSVTLDKLHIRDNGVCHLCNKKTNYNDFVITDHNHFIAGDNYPSIDHVIPIAKGGLHRWDNVKLAHRRCNYIKRDDEYEFQTFLNI